MDIGGTFTTIRVPGFADTQVLGINNNGLAVGQAFGPKGFTEGFVYNVATKAFTIVTDPNGIGSTVVNGINDAGDLVGFYTNSTGYTIGMLATPTPRRSRASLRLGPRAHSFDAWSLLAPDAGMHSSLHYEAGGAGTRA